MYNTNEEMITIYSADINWGLTPEFPSCKTIDILNYFNFKVAPARQIFFQFEKVKDLSVALYVEDRNKALRRPLKVCRTSVWLYSQCTGGKVKDIELKNAQCKTFYML